MNAFQWDYLWPAWLMSQCLHHLYWVCSTSHDKTDCVFWEHISRTWFDWFQKVWVFLKSSFEIFHYRWDLNNNNMQHAETFIQSEWHIESMVSLGDRQKFWWQVCHLVTYIWTFFIGIWGCLSHWKLQHVMDGVYTCLLDFFVGLLLIMWWHYLWDSTHKILLCFFLRAYQFDGDSGRPGAMRESELVGLLLRISDECTTAIEQMQQSLQQRQTQLFAKELRSRQRENLKKLLVW